MCDGGCCSQNSSWSNGFYNQYLQQHAQMMQWVQQLQGNNSYHDQSNVEYCRCCHEQANPVPQYATNAIEYPYSSPQYDQQTHPAEEVEGYVEHGEMYEEEEDYSSSGDELELNLDAILAMRAEKANNPKKAEEENFEFIDSLVDEEFEYVELNEFGRLDKKRGLKFRPDTRGEGLHEKATKKFLYGEKADMIAGLETSIAINFERLCDIHQPHLWPVLPLRL